MCFPLLPPILNDFCRYSKQDFVQPVPKPYAMPDGSPSYMEFTGNRGNRFTNPDAAAKNRILADI